MNFEVRDFDKYNKVPFFPSFLQNDETLNLAKDIDAKLEEINKNLNTLANQFDENVLINNTDLLDRKGELLDVSRNGKNNTDYYKEQQLKYLFNLNKSTVPDILKILKTYFSAENIRIRPHYPGGIVILHDGDESKTLDYYSVIRETIGAGISYETRELYVFKDAKKIIDNINDKGGQITINTVIIVGGLFNGEKLFNGEVAYNGYADNRTSEIITF